MPLANLHAPNNELRLALKFMEFGRFRGQDRVLGFELALEPLNLSELLPGRTRGVLIWVASRVVHAPNSTSAITDMQPNPGCT